MELFEKAVGRVVALFHAGHPITVAWSSGKDSSCCLAVVLEAAIQAKAAGDSPVVVITHSNTGVENPEVENFVKSEMAKIHAFVTRHGLNADIRVAMPALGSGWMVRVLSGRALPAFPGGNSDCSTDFKVTPMRRLRKRVFAEIGKDDREVVTVVGTRFDESVTRGAAMRERGESWERPIRNKDGDLVLSAIADWTLDDVWDLIAYARMGEIVTYSDFDDLFRLYADGGGTSCAVVSDAIMEENAAAAKKSGGCGARFGCSVCTRVANDKSVTAMIEGDPDRYAYLAPLNRLREYIVANHWDMSKRMWVGRSISDDGWIAIQPDTYSPAYVLDLLRYVLTIQIREQETAEMLGIKPRFSLIDLKQLAAIGATWSLQGYHKPFQAVREWVDIYELGKRYDVPENPVVYVRGKMPEPRYYFVGDDWDEGQLINSGLRDVVLEMVSDGSDGCMGTKSLKNGNVVMDVNTAGEFDFDAEGLGLAFAFELDTMLEINANASSSVGLTREYRWWASMGPMLLSPRQVSIHDEILRRTAFKERHGLAGADYDLDALLKKSVSKKDLLAGATTAEAQSRMLRFLQSTQMELLAA